MRYSHTVFSQLLKALPRHHFERFVKRHRSDFRVRKLRSWDQFVAMLFAQLSGRKSLRDLEGSLNSHHNHFYHLGINPVHRSTLADANHSRSADLYKDIFSHLLQHVNRKTARKARKIINILDATIIKLHPEQFAWALGHNNYSEVKIHTVYNPTEEIPTQFDITHGFVGEMTTAKQRKLTANTTYIYDRAYYDYRWWKKLDDRRCRFVTRLKKNCRKSVLEERKCDGNILKDQLIRIGGRERRDSYKKPLREITINIKEKEKLLSVVTNDLASSAQEIADLYKKRWQIEVFFKWIKQNLKIKTFLGTSENAVKTQIIIAMISYLLLRLWQNMSSLNRTMFALARIIQTNLMTRRSIWELFEPPPRSPQNNQLKLNWDAFYA